MRILNVKAFEGKNIYSHKKCIRIDVDLEGYSDIPSKDIKGFNENLVELIPELKTHRCGIDEDMGFIKRLNEGTYLAHICEHIVLALHNKIGLDVSYGKAREIKGNNYYIIYQYIYKNTGIEIGRLAVDTINFLIKGKAINLKDRLNEIKNIYEREKLGPSTESIIKEAKNMGIPVIRVGDRSVFQIGYGKDGRLIQATMGSKTSAVSMEIACDKLLTKEILYRNYIPVALGGKVRNSLELLIEAESIGYPVVLKPRYGNQGKGVFVKLKNEKELLAAYEKIKDKYEDLIIEEYIQGRDFRVCVVDYKIVAVSERIPPFVIGNGKNTVKELIDLLNLDERRGVGHEKPLTKVKLDDELKMCINKKGYSLETVLKDGERLTLRENANLSTGGIAVDYTDKICQENIEICTAAAKAIGLDICGIDICCSDISKPIDGAIIEVNAAPGIRMHEYPCEGKPRNVAGEIVKMLTKDINREVPVISITGTNGKTTTTRLIGHTFSLLGYNVGMTTTGGIYIGNKCIEKGDTTGYNSALSVLLNKDVEVAVLETARGGIVKRGLAYDLADVAVITNITEDHLGIDGIETMEDLAFVKSLVAEEVKPDGHVVINADDKWSLTILNRITASKIMFSNNKDNETLRKNINDGGYGIYIDNDFICIEKSGAIYPLIKVDEIKIGLNGKLSYNIQNAMAAVGALIALNIDYSVIRESLITFSCDAAHNPGRFNIYDVNGLNVILDYGHNIDGYKAVLEGAKKLKHNRLIGVIGVPGDRTNGSIMECGKISGDNFDYIFIKEDMDKRGRRPGETAELLKKGVLDSKLDAKNIRVVLDEKEALSEALNFAKPGDTVIIFYEEYDSLVNIIKERSIKDNFISSL